MKLSKYKIYIALVDNGAGKVSETSKANINFETFNLGVLINHKIRMGNSLEGWGISVKYFH